MKGNGEFSEDVVVQAGGKDLPVLNIKHPMRLSPWRLIQRAEVTIHGLISKRPASEGDTWGIYLPDPTRELPDPFLGPQSPTRR
jgi:hypothetical protein